MANFDYNPGVQDRRGDYFAAGISSAFNSLANGIQQAEQKHKENKAYAQLAETLGLDPKHTTKEQVQVALLKNSLQEQLATRQRQQQAQSALGSMLQQIVKNRAGRQVNYMQAPNQGPLQNPRTVDQMSPFDAITNALAKNPAIFQDPKTASTAASLSKILGTIGNDGGIMTDPTTGIPFVRSGTSVRPINPAWLRPKTGGPGSVEIPGVGTVYTNNGREVNPKFAVPPGGIPATKGGKYPKDAKIVQMDGKDVALFPDGSWTPLTGNGNTDEQDIINAARGGAGAPQENGTEGTEGTNGTDSSLFTDASGAKWRYLGHAADPMTDKEQDHWEEVQ